MKGVVGFGDGKMVATDLWDHQLGEAGVRLVCIGERLSARDEHADWEIDWRLWTGKDGLVRRA